MDISEFVTKKENVLAIISEAKSWAEGGSKYFLQAIDNFDELRTRLNRDDVFIAILGRQGAGKSTLGNVFLEGKNILPMDVEETTNILTMVTGVSEETEEYAEVIFEDKNPIKGNLSADFLEAYVSDKEGYNLKNEKKVTEVRCYAHVNWLEEANAWLVDTPGVNSLREYNHEITFDFLPKVTVGVFLCTVNPTIQKDEKLFLDSIWTQRPLMYFVQNRYGEPLSDVKQSEEWNLNVFSELSEKDAENVMETDKKIYTVEVGNALNAYEYEDPTEELEESGAKELLDDLSSSINDRLKSIRLKNSISNLLNLVQVRIKGYEGKLKNLESEIVLGKEKVEKDKKKKQEVYEQSRKNISAFYNDLLQELNTFHGKSLRGLQAKADSAKKDLLIQCENSSMSPEYFQDEFKATVKRYFDPPIDTYRLGSILDAFIRSTADELEELSDKLGKISKETIIEGMKESKTQTEYDTDTSVESEDFMKFLAYTLDAVGYLRTGVIVWGVGSAMIGAGSLAAALTAGGIAFSAVPLLGWIIAAGCTLGAFLLKGHIKKKQKEALKSAAIKSLNETYLKIKSQIESSAKEVPAKSEEVHQAILNKIKEMFENSAMAIESLQSAIEEQKQSAAEIKIQIETGEKILKKCEGVL